jgi:hypothetical protein
MSKSLAAGASYFLIVFAAGFALGAIRVGALAPAVGDVAATLIELPFILGASWFACLVVIARFKVPAQGPARLAMGAVAFTFLIGAEIALGLVLMDRSFAAQVEAMSEPSGLLGLAGQILFALFPLIALRARQQRANRG